MVINKRAQFFLLAAVIISAIVISLGITANRAVVNMEPGSFYDFSYEVKREAGAVLDYEVYSGFSNNANLDVFVDLLADDIRDGNPDANFLFLYGNNQTMELRNYGSTTAAVGTGQVSGSGTSTISSICIGSYCQSITNVVSSFNQSVGSTTLTAANMSGSSNLTVGVSGYDFSFPISRHRQVIFIMQKDVDDESFIAVG
jgi:hypothetical protein